MFSALSVISAVESNDFTAERAEDAGALKYLDRTASIVARISVGWWA
jgi:hypothetical protein